MFNGGYSKPANIFIVPFSSKRSLTLLVYSGILYRQANFARSYPQWRARVTFDYLSCQTSSRSRMWPQCSGIC